MVCCRFVVVFFLFCCCFVVGLSLVCCCFVGVVFSLLCFGGLFRDHGPEQWAQLQILAPRSPKSRSLEIFADSARKAPFREPFRESSAREMGPTLDPPSTIPEISKSRNFCRFRVGGSASGAFSGIMGPKNGPGLRNLHPGYPKSRNLEIFAASAWKAPFREPFSGSRPRKWGQLQILHPRPPKSRNLENFAVSA